MEFYQLLVFQCFKPVIIPGIMITASHNPYFDNGIKLFNSQGFKLSTSADAEIERGILDFDNKYHLEDLEPSIKTQIYPQKIYSKCIG